ncbi:MAG: alkylation response protein AidB-like acyl-CoA dehydrogenase [Candidatus Poriferisodalaceae bacterium]|jgi:alkylation response protein AidB-like acyl-CoA dehydrogenase
MSFELRPRTARGEVLVGAAASLVATFAERAHAADAANKVCRENFEDLHASGISSALIPEELGGGGLESIHDWILLIATLARGDASTAIAITMHHGVCRGLSRVYSQAKRDLGPDHETTQGLTQSFRNMVAGEMLVCATATEVGTDNVHPMTEVVRDGDGWRINGHKIFVTMSPIASHVSMVVRLRDEDGDSLANVLLPMTTPGLMPQGDWDALGMRSSGSQSIVIKDAWVPLDTPRKLGTWGEWNVGFMEFRAIANIVLVGAFLGIAEAAHDIALERVLTRSRVGEPVAEMSGVQNVVGEMALELAQCRAMLGAAGVQMDEYSERHASTPASLQDAHHLMNDYQAAKWTVNRGAIGVVSKAMDLLSGSGYTNSHVLARLYRDVRAGPFMQPYGATELREYVGKITLGQYPNR